MITMDTNLTSASQLLQLEDEHVAHNHHPLDVMVSDGSGGCSPTSRARSIWISWRRTPPTTSVTVIRRSSLPPRNSSTV